ncbi:hypothetical protein [Geodermatophilus marinus]|uniref:hypothetical protein n=1 Tax=Geodermatophilus sp. LHW52908 TaxID=2303986 RepID=UPI000E3C1315|nr:hypothetical protein [Geodermatophilus sp. LHW52908]RFU19854.1 hypothetical protein D0Z06_19415 [Geodermatophilus sp. LHW52908]
MAPLDPFQGEGDQGGGIPAADPGRGAPEPAEGFGPGAEEPDVPEPGRSPVEAAHADDDPPLPTPDPDRVGPDGGR